MKRRGQRDTGHSWWLGNPPGWRTSRSSALWHQVRCIASILFLVGLGREPPGVVAHMLDLARCRKPVDGARGTDRTPRDATGCTWRVGHVVRAGMWAEPRD